MLKSTILITTLFLGLSWALLPQRVVARSRHHVSPLSRLNAALPNGYQECGDQIIHKAGELCGIQKKEDLDIEWKADRIIVTIRGSVYVSNPDEEIGEGGDDESDLEPSQKSGVDITELARAINFALGEDEVGNAIAETHEIEVGTPGVSEELSGVMFEAYKGFDVICRYDDPKKNKVTEILGRLHDRTEEITVINIKGRMKKIKNESIQSLKLPKAKKEKGAK